MTVLKPSAEVPAIVIPFKVRLEPYLVESVCALARLVRDKGNAHTGVTGLLFGHQEAGSRTIEALKAFEEAGPHSELARRERLEHSYKKAMDEAKGDPELSSLEVVGWFSFRSGSGLLGSDVTFHNQHFRKAEDLALIVWREGPSQITAELYSRDDGDTLTSEDYRWGSVRLSADIRHMREPVELAMRVKLKEDSYLNAYETAEPENQFGGLLRKAEAATDKFFNLFSRKPEEANGARVRALIGDGRLPNRAAWPPEAKESAIHPQAYFNPYAETARRAGAQGAGYKVGAAVGSGGPAWPGTQPASNLTANVPGQQTNQPMNQPGPLNLVAPAPLDFGSLGQHPRSGRGMASEVSGLPMLLHPPSQKKAFPWPMAVALFVVCSGAVFAFLLMGGLQGDSGRLGQAFHAIFPSSELNMRVRTEDDRLRLSWNPRNRAVATALDGTLQIFDGQQHREVHLEGRQVSDGSVLYRPLTNDVTFRLEIRSEQGGTSGSIRVLDGLSSQQSALDVSAPKAAAASAVQAPSEPTLLSNSATPATQDPNAPTILRPGTDQSPLTDVPYASSPRAARAAPRYVTPQNIGTFPDSTGAGSTINGWDTTAAKGRGKQRPVRTGVFSPASTGFVGPKPLMQVMPRTSSIPSGSIQSRTRVQVQVRVDSTGKVSSAQLVGSPVNEAVSSAALAAARQWTFVPATSNGRRVDSDHTIVYEFRPDH